MRINFYFIFIFVYVLSNPVSFAKEPKLFQIDALAITINQRGCQTLEACVKIIREMYEQKNPEENTFSSTQTKALDRKYLRPFIKTSLKTSVQEAIENLVASDFLQLSEIKFEYLMQSLESIRTSLFEKSFGLVLDESSIREFSTFKDKGLPTRYLLDALSNINGIIFTGSNLDLADAAFFPNANIIALPQERFLNKDKQFDLKSIDESALVPLYHELWHRYYLTQKESNAPIYSAMEKIAKDTFTDVPLDHRNETINEASALFIESFISNKLFEQRTLLREDSDKTRKLIEKVKPEYLESDILGYYHPDQSDTSKMGDISFTKIPLPQSAKDILINQVLNDEIVVDSDERAIEIINKLQNPINQLKDEDKTITLNIANQQYAIPIYQKDLASKDDFQFIINHCQDAPLESFDNEKQIDQIAEVAKKFGLPTKYIETLKGKVKFEENPEELKELRAAAAFNPITSMIYLKFKASDIEEANLPVIFHELWHAYFEFAIDPKEKSWIIQTARADYAQYQKNVLTPLEILISEASKRACKKQLKLFSDVSELIVDEAIGNFIQDYVDTYLFTKRMGGKDLSKYPQVEKGRKGLEDFGYYFTIDDEDISPEKPINPIVRDFVIEHYLEALKF